MALAELSLKFLDRTLTSRVTVVIIPPLVLQVVWNIKTSQRLFDDFLLILGGSDEVEEKKVTVLVVRD